MDQLREFFWSQRLAQWAPFAGLLAVLRVRRGAIAALLGGWLAAFLVVKGFSPRATIESGSFWRLLMPAWPAYLLLFASIPLLVPTLARRLGDRACSRRRPGRLAALDRRRGRARDRARSRRSRSPRPRRSAGRSTQTVVQDFESGNILTPVDDGRRARRRARRRTARRLTWTDGGPWRADVFYRVYRARRPGRRHGLLALGRRRLVLRARTASRSRRRATSPIVDPDRRLPDGHVPDRRRDELDRRPGGGGRLRVQPSGCRSRLRRSSSSAIRCARSTFSSVSREITVE